MSKRFTDTAKWNKRWFRSLSPQDKLAWVYLCDNCDAAGVIDLDAESADFHIRSAVDWAGFLERSERRVERLPSGRLWLTTFVTFQYPTGLSEDCPAHRPIFKSLGENGLLERVLHGYQNPSQTEQDKETETAKDKGSGKGIAKGKPQIAAESVPVPAGFETPAVRTAIAEWLSYKARKGKPYKDAAFLGRKVAEFATPAEFVAAVNSSIGNNYEGIYPARGTNGRPRDNSTRSDNSGERSL